jgi:hypothetical protein
MRTGDDHREGPEDTKPEVRLSSAEDGPREPAVEDELTEKVVERLREVNNE